ncbi:hypothetical protein N658DRAFT_309884 [Parathielavia hyrcaniae]|uniref:Uncharacterized protein n=1 Tax=Parathielavia hyrcaniae TaxID=113614 RepID=A0AAN6Q9F7_9PEZI|nr:hypothetical protein N658DRAFT_309884 [Parathielavia hyrcaniae]
MSVWNSSAPARAYTHQRSRTGMVVRGRMARSSARPDCLANQWSYSRRQALGQHGQLLPCIAGFGQFPTTREQHHSHQGILHHARGAYYTVSYLHIPVIAQPSTFYRRTSDYEFTYYTFTTRSREPKPIREDEETASEAPVQPTTLPSRQLGACARLHLFTPSRIVPVLSGALGPSFPGSPHPAIGGGS